MSDSSDSTAGGSPGADAFEWAAPVGTEGVTVGQGECMHSISKDHGFFWETLWEHPSNEKLKEARGDPNVLLPGDMVFIPELRRGEESGATEQRHRFRRLGVPARVVMVIMEDDEPVADADYVLVVDGERLTGKTGSDGKVEQAVPNEAREALLTVRPGDRPLVYKIRLGSLDPCDTVAGLQTRLMNLGYAVAVTGEIDLPTTRSVGEFQTDNGLEGTGTVDRSTCEKLREVHGS